jgi:hypothetical protein
VTVAGAWFARLGRALSPADVLEARAYLAALGYGDSLEVCLVSSWQQAESILRDPDWDVHWWQREEAERTRLQAVAVAKLGEAAAFERLSATTAVNADVIHDAATLAGASSGADAALIRCASGAAAMAAHERAAAELAGCGPEHLFMRKYRLFESGRWPLGVLRNRFFLF